MQQELILYPVFAQLLLTFGVGIWLLRLRIRAVKNRELHPRYFKLNRGGKVPEKLQQVTHNYDNQFEIPMLFYTASIATLAVGAVDTISLTLAWLFVISRLAHCYIHTTYNHILHRLSAFAFGALCVLGISINLAVTII